MASTMLIVAVVLVMLGITSEARSTPVLSERCPTSQELHCVYSNCTDSAKTPLYIKLNDGRQCEGCDQCHLDTSDGCVEWSCYVYPLDCQLEAGQTSTEFRQYYKIGNEECSTCPALACV